MNKKIFDNEEKYDKLKSNYQTIYDEICSAQDKVQPIKDERNKYHHLFIEHQAILLYFEKFLFLERVLISDIFEENFVFEKPRSTISGDFYWIEKKDNKIYFALGDCPGFDVASLLPKTMVLTLLREEIAKNNERNENSALLLKNLRERYIELYNSIKSNDLTYFKNVELSVIIIDEKLKLIDFSGSSNSLICISNNSLNEYKGSRIPIGLNYMFTKAEHFTNTIFEYKPDDKIYL